MECFIGKGNWKQHQRDYINEINRKKKTLSLTHMDNVAHKYPVKVYISYISKIRFTMRMVNLLLKQRTFGVSCVSKKI